MVSTAAPLTRTQDSNRPRCSSPLSRQVQVGPPHVILKHACIQLTFKIRPMMTICDMVLKGGKKKHDVIDSCSDKSSRSAAGVCG